MAHGFPTASPRLLHIGARGVGDALEHDEMASLAQVGDEVVTAAFEAVAADDIEAERQGNVGVGQRGLNIGAQDFEIVGAEMLHQPLAKDGFIGIGHGWGRGDRRCVVRIAPGKVATAGIDIMPNIRPAVGSHLVDGDGLGLVNLICRNVVVVKDKLAHEVKIIGLGGAR